MTARDDRARLTTCHVTDVFASADPVSLAERRPLTDRRHRGVTRVSVSRNVDGPRARARCRAHGRPRTTCVAPPHGVVTLPVTDRRQAPEVHRARSAERRHHRALRRRERGAELGMRGVRRRHRRLTEDRAPDGHRRDRAHTYVARREQQAAARRAGPARLDPEPAGLLRCSRTSRLRHERCHPGRAACRIATSAASAGLSITAFARSTRSAAVETVCVAQPARIRVMGVRHTQRHRCRVEPCDERRAIARHPDGEGFRDVVRRRQQQREQQVPLGEHLAGTDREVRSTLSDRLPVQERRRPASSSATDRSRRGKAGSASSTTSAVIAFATEPIGPLGRWPLVLATVPRVLVASAKLPCRGTGIGGAGLPPSARTLARRW